MFLEDEINTHDLEISQYLKSLLKKKKKKQVIKGKDSDKKNLQPKL